MLFKIMTFTPKSQHFVYKNKAGQYNKAITIFVMKHGNRMSPE